MKHSTAGGKHQHGNAENSVAGARSRRVNGEAEFALGYLYKSIENDIDTYTAQTGYAYSLAHTAFRLGRLLEAKALRIEPGLAQLVPEMRANGAPALLGAGNQFAGHDGTAEAQVHVRALSRRTLSTAARARIARAQRNAGGVGTQPKHKGNGYSKGARGYWASMTPEQRSAEMMRRREVAAQKKKG